MGLGPSLSIRQSQQLVLTPQLRQAIQLLQLSNLELDAFLAEEMSKNPLLEAQPDEAGDPPTSEIVGDDGEGEPDDAPILDRDSRTARPNRHSVERERFGIGEQDLSVSRVRQ